MPMKIYTKTGDGGETSLLGGRRTSKDSLRIEAYGTVDELNSLLGLCRSLNTVSEIDAHLALLQRELFVLGADLAADPSQKQQNVPHLPEDAVSRLETAIDSIEPRLEPLKNFILPGGTRTAAILHLARTVCRRAERLVVHLSRTETVNRNSVVYLNRLSDFLFVLARLVNSISGTAEELWTTGPGR
jgi:cob(I)alamin adenosyltransferase